MKFFEAKFDYECFLDDEKTHTKTIKEERDEIYKLKQEVTKLRTMKMKADTELRIGKYKFEREKKEYEKKITQFEKEEAEYKRKLRVWGCKNIENTKKIRSLEDRIRSDESK